MHIYSVVHNMHINKNSLWVDEMRRGAGHGVSLKLRHAFTSAILLSLIWQLIVECESAAPNCSPSELPISVEPTPDGSLEDALRALDHVLGNCTVRLYLLSGVHVISSGVAVSKTKKRGPLEPPEQHGSPRGEMRR